MSLMCRMSRHAIRMNGAFLSAKGLSSIGPDSNKQSIARFGFMESGEIRGRICISIYEQKRTRADRSAEITSVWIIKFGQ